MKDGLDEYRTLTPAQKNQFWAEFDAAKNTHPAGTSREDKAVEQAYRRHKKVE